ncbi:MAG: hypothetical protein M3257_09900 [Actinomycetota bacterium]|nr:hypothetical protein [Actinomycetota bacterium]
MPGVSFLVALVAAGMRGAARPVVLAVGAVPLVVARAAVRARSVRRRGPARCGGGGLEPVPGYLPRPPELSRSARPDGDAVVVTRALVL